MIESTEFGPQLAAPVASATASRICCRIQIWFAPTGTFTSKVGMPVSWQIAPSPSAAWSMFCAMIVSACAERVPSGSASMATLHRRAHVGRQIGRGLDDEVEHAVEEGGQHAEQYNSRTQRRRRLQPDRRHELTLAVCSSAPNAIRSASARCRPTRTTACRPRARSRTSPSAACARPPELVTATVLVKKAAAEANAALGRLAARRRRRDRRGGRRDPRRRARAISSSSTSTRPAPARRTT